MDSHDPRNDSSSKSESTRRRKLRRWSGFAFLLMLVGPYFFSRMAAPFRRCRIIVSASDSKACDSSDSLKIAIFNIAHGRGKADSNLSGDSADKTRRIQEIAEYLKRLDADVVVLNEVDFCSTWSGHENQAATIAKLAGYPFRVEQRNFDMRFLYGSWKFGNAVLSRKPIERCDPIELPALRLGESLFAGQKQASVVTLRISKSRTVKLVPVHLDARSELTRLRSVQTICDHLHSESGPIVLAGDFNSTPTQMPGSEASSNGGNAINYLDESGDWIRQTIEPKKSQFTFSTMAPSRTIDWIIVSRRCELSSYEILDSELSDHRPVKSHVRFPPREAAEVD